MTSTNDLDLLGEFTRDQSQDAFTMLVQRHLGLVYCAALRQVRSPQLAEEVAQSVFTDLARAAARLEPDTILTAWLYEVTRRTAINVVRGEARRQFREQIAVEMNAMNATADDWMQIEPLLDEAMHALDDTDRTAVLLRYFENKSLREVGDSLGTTDDTARKRVNRAIERLREFFAKRGVTVGASGLAVVISANAVQTAPVGLAITISTAAALAGTSTLITATATVGKAIAMTTLQKTLIATTLVAAVGTGIYEVRKTSVLQNQVQTLQQQQAPLAEHVGRLTRERDEAMSQLASLRDNRPANADTAELIRLRGEVSRLRNDSKELAQLKTSKVDDLTESSAKSWANRVNQLKQRLEQNPAAMIPELKLLTDQDWLDAAKGELKTETDYRRALSALRGAGEHKIASMLTKALTGYRGANNEQFPTDLAHLQPHFESTVEDAILQRWEIAPAATIKNLGLGGDVIITQKAPVDEVFDTRFGIGPHGTGSTDFLQAETENAMRTLREAFRAEHNGKWPTANSQLLPYATTPEQQAALQKWSLRESISK